jgi:hypothetical protein
MRIQNRVGLVEAACERYQVVNNEYIRLDFSRYRLLEAAETAEKQ